MEQQNLFLDGRDYVLVLKSDFDELVARSNGPTSAGTSLPPLPAPDKDGNRPAIKNARVMLARTLIVRMNGVGVSQAQLSRESDVPAATINRILKATRTADESTILKIEKALTRLGRKAKRPNGSKMAACSASSPASSRG